MLACAESDTAIFTVADWALDDHLVTGPFEVLFDFVAVLYLLAPWTRHALLWTLLLNVLLQLGYTELLGL